MNLEQTDSLPAIFLSKGPPTPGEVNNKPCETSTQPTPPGGIDQPNRSHNHQHPYTIYGKNAWYGIVT